MQEWAINLHIKKRSTLIVLFFKNDFIKATWFKTSCWKLYAEFYWIFAVVCSKLSSSKDFQCQRLINWELSICYEKLYLFIKPCTHLHPPPPSSMHLHPAHFNLHLVHFSHRPAHCNTLSVITTKIWQVTAQFPKI